MLKEQITKLTNALTQATTPHYHHHICCDVNIGHIIIIIIIIIINSEHGTAYQDMAKRCWMSIIMGISFIVWADSVIGNLKLVGLDCVLDETQHHQPSWMNMHVF